MEVSGQLHASAALSPGKDLPVFICLHGFALSQVQSGLHGEGLS